MGWWRYLSAFRAHFFLCLVLILKKKYELFGFVFIHVTGKDDIPTYEKRSTTIIIII